MAPAHCNAKPAAHDTCSIDSYLWLAWLGVLCLEQGGQQALVRDGQPSIVWLLNDRVEQETACAGQHVVPVHVVLHRLYRVAKSACGKFK
jgi:hypothetical protein